MGTSKRDLLGFPQRVISAIGYDLGAVQYGEHPPSAKPWKGLGPGVWELAEQDASGTYRAVYTVQFARAIYVLHAFQKKSPAGIRTSRKDVALITQRLTAAKQDYEVHYGKEED
jgi:phage-related protein